MFEYMKKVWTDLEDAGKYDAGEKRKAQVRAAKENKEQRQRAAAEKRKAKEEEALWSASLQDEEVDYERESDAELSADEPAINADGMSDDEQSDDSAKADSPHFKRSAKVDQGEDERRRTEEREQSRTTADEPTIAKDPKQVERRKKGAAKPKPPNEYDPNRPGLGFTPAAGASLGLSLADFDLDAMTEEQFDQYIIDREEQEFKTQTRKLTVEKVLETAKKRAAAGLGSEYRI